MQVERVERRDDPRLRDFLDLKDTQMRAAREPAEGFFLAEGEATIRRALAAGYRPRAVLGTDRRAAALADLDVVVYVVDDDVLTATTGFLVHRGALASFARKPLPDPEEVLATADRVVVLEDLVDHTNVGAIFRSAAGLGWDAVLLTPRTADPLYRRSVRTSMGAVFAVPWTRLEHRTGPALLRDAGFVRIALTPDPSADPLDGSGPTGRRALIVGSEGPGMSNAWLEAADHRVQIRMHGGIDSLNVASAAAIALYRLGPQQADG